MFRAVSTLSLFRVLVAALFLISLCEGQVTVGKISGTVTDQSGALMPGVIVTAIAQGTGVSTQAVTSENGGYVFPSLVAGTYTVTTGKTGFGTRREDGIVLDAASSRVVNFALSPGTVTETISVTATEAQVKTDSAEVSDTLDTRKLDQIAMNGRNYMELVNFLPGVAVGTLDPSSVGSSTIGSSINGSRTPSTGVSMDGVNTLLTDNNQGQIVVPNPDTIAEVKILTASYAAEYGGNLGAQITVVTKSGTKEFHGSLFEYLRNSDFDARSFFAATREPLHLNDFGGTFGGPIFVPHKLNADRNKFFFFGGIEDKYQHTETAAVSVIPTLLEREGNFTLSSIKPIDPLSGAPFPGAIIPVNRFSYNGPRMLAVYPVPNSNSPAGNFVLNPLSVSDPFEMQIKLDYILNDKTRITGSAAYDSFATWNNGGALGIAKPGSWGGQPGAFGGINATTTITPNLVNYASSNVAIDHSTHAIPSPELSRTALGIDFPELSPAPGITPQNSYGSAPKITMTGYTGYGNADPGLGKGTTSIQFSDDLTYVRGSHVFKFGAMVIRGRDNENTCGCSNENGTFAFSTAAAQTSKNVIADVLLGNFYEYTQDLYSEHSLTRSTTFETFAQDSWKVNGRFTVNYGVRYSLDRLPHSPEGNESIFDPALYNPAQAVTVSPTTGAIVAGSGNIYNGMSLREAPGPTFRTRTGYLTSRSLLASSIHCSMDSRQASGKPRRKILHRALE